MYPGGLQIHQFRSIYISCLGRILAKKENNTATCVNFHRQQGTCPNHDTQKRSNTKFIGSCYICTLNPLPKRERMSALLRGIPWWLPAPQLPSSTVTTPQKGFDWLSTESPWDMLILCPPTQTVVVTHETHRVCVHQYGSDGSSDGLVSAICICFYY